jgi:Rad3-related DNA helicase
LTNYIQTTYKQRQNSLPNIVEAIATMVQEKTGNYLVFFPSYKYLDDTYQLFKELFPTVQTIVQDTEMNEEEREQFLAKFVANPAETLVGFCVLGGIFSEGIDLKGTRLIGSAIVGVGLPQINHEQELIREYFDEHTDSGFEYAYQLPGMNKVLQAAGRVIRDLTDVGVVLLLDQRFNTLRYRQLFPPHWQPTVCYRPQDLVKELRTFWQKTSN